MSASLYPVDEDKISDKVPTTVRLRMEVHQDVLLLAQLWNEFDKLEQKKRKKKWKPASVLERLVAAGVDNFWSQVGGRPQSKEGREEFVRQALERVKKAEKKK